MTEHSVRQVGEVRSLYCQVCGEERTFVWTAWPGMEFYGYPSAPEFGWECSGCGNRLREA